MREGKKNKKQQKTERHRRENRDPRYEGGGGVSRTPDRRPPPGADIQEKSARLAKPGVFCSVLRFCRDLV